MLERRDDVELADRLRAGRERILEELRKLIVGQEDVIDQVLLSVFVGGNSLIVGVDCAGAGSQILADSVHA